MSKETKQMVRLIQHLNLDPVLYSSDKTSILKWIISTVDKMKPEFLRPLQNGLLGTPSKNKELSVDLFCYIDCQSDFKRQNLALSRIWQIWSMPRKISLPCEWSQSETRTSVCVHNFGNIVLVFFPHKKRAKWHKCLSPETFRGIFPKSVCF